MCIIPKAPKVPQAAQFQQMQVPQDPANRNTSLASRMRRGLWASIMTSPQGVSGPPTVTGPAAGKLGA